MSHQPLASGVVGAVTRHQLLVCARAWWAADIPLAPRAWTALVWWWARQVSLAAETAWEMEHHRGDVAWQRPLL